MRIAIIPSADLTYNSGSVIHAKRLFAWMRREGHSAFLLGSRAPGDIPPDCQPFVHVVADLLNHPVVIDREVSDIEYLGSFQATLDFLSRLHGTAPLDVVHCQYASFASYAARIFQVLTGTPYVVSSYGRDLASAALRDRRFREMARCSLKAASAIIVPSTAVAAQVSAFVGAGACPIEEIPVPLDLTGFDAVATTGAPVASRPVLASVNSSFAEDKGVDVILEAVALLRREFPVAAVIAGSDDHPTSANARRLRETTKRLGLEDVVTFPGYLGRAEVASLLRGCAVLVDARTGSGFSSVLLEAQFCGCAVLASRTPGSSAIINDGINGVLFAAGDPRSLAKEALQILQSAPLRDSLRAASRTWSREQGRRYDESTCISRISDIYQRVRRRP